MPPLPPSAAAPLPLRAAACGALLAVFVLAPLLYVPALYVPYAAKLPVASLLCGFSLFAALSAAGGFRPAFRLASSGLPGLIGLAGFAFFALLSAALSPYPRLSVPLAVASACAAGLGFAASCVAARDVSLRSVAALSGAAAAAVAGVLGYEALFCEHLTGLMGNKNIAASWLILVVFLPVSGFLNPGASRREKIFFGLCALLSSGALLLTRSRAGILAALVSAGLYYCAVRRVKNRRIFAAFAAAIAALAAVLLWSGLLSDVRWPIWRAALGMFADRPLLGWGPGAFGVLFPLFVRPDYYVTAGASPFNDFAHSRLLELLAGTGIAGTALYLGAVVWVFCAIAGNIRGQTDPERRLLLCALGCGGAGVLLHNLFDANLDMAPWLELLLWCGLGLAAFKNPSGPEPAPGAAARAFGSQALLWLMVFSVIWGMIFGRALAGQYLFRRAVMDKFFGRLERAGADFDRALALCPWEKEFEARRAFYLAESGQPERSAAAYERLLARFPAYPFAHRNLAVLSLRLGDLPGAVLESARALRLNPHDDQAALALEKAWDAVFAPPPPPQDQ